MSEHPEPGALAPGQHSVLEDSLELFEANLNQHDPVHRQAAQLANLCVQLAGAYVLLMREAHERLLPEDRKAIIPPHQELGIEALSRLGEIIGIDD
ncbi:hypothetical protein ACIF85_08905 [Streptomyces sp. NPDC086033]|uniref:hypothetical protein n=1 Tax=Streptomyces sp. NPDC086033 TaxID=3365747 RepID=UPI0037CE0527